MKRSKIEEILAKLASEEQQRRKEEEVEEVEEAEEAQEQEAAEVEEERLPPRSGCDLEGVYRKFEKFLEQYREVLGDPDDSMLKTLGKKFIEALRASDCELVARLIEAACK